MSNCREVLRGYAAGAVDFLIKPIDPRVLDAKLAVLLHLQRQKLELAARVQQAEASQAPLREAMEQSRRQLSEIQAIYDSAHIGAGAELLGISDRAGTLEAGKLADVIAVPGDPTRDIRVVEKVMLVMKEGAIHRDDRPAAFCAAPASAPRE